MQKALFSFPPIPDHCPENPMKEDSIIELEIPKQRYHIDPSLGEGADTLERQSTASDSDYGSTSPLPASPKLRPLRLSSIDEPTASSLWRLSFTSKNRGSCLRALSLKHPLIDSHTTEGSEGEQHRPQRLLLRVFSDGLSDRPPLKASSHQEDMHTDPEGHHYSATSTTIDVVEELPSVLHLQDMNISKRLASLSSQSLASSTGIPFSKGFDSVWASKLAPHNCRMSNFVTGWRKTNLNQAAIRVVLPCRDEAIDVTNIPCYLSDKKYPLSTPRKSLFTLFPSYSKSSMSEKPWAQAEGKHQLLEV